jgi:hypothetical protein
MTFFRENDGPLSFGGAPGGWDSARFLALFAASAFSRFQTFISLAVPRRGITRAKRQKQVSSRFHTRDADQLFL